MTTRKTRHPEPDAALDISEMWRGLLATGWHSLAVVPTDKTVSCQVVADALASVASSSEGTVHRIDARGADIAAARQRVGEVQSLRDSEQKTVVFVDSLMESLSGVHLVREVDAVLLVVRVGSIDVESLTSSVSMIGPDKIVGSVTGPALG
jgi:hypothetical protein